MKKEINNTESSRQYAAAYELHYGSENLREAFTHYQNILREHPKSKEAGYARSQLQNIIRGMVPKEELLESQVKLATAIFDKEKGQYPNV
ncbi:MAG: hypothetical protein JXX29_19190 [Deltaproteobacteria bacterium]|nr:hypothetical protein [Deltaproteobacteria bacterium]MBN2673813.1 hypothetical protein [Deltaproteobacteria bacterium]